MWGEPDARLQPRSQAPQSCNIEKLGVAWVCACVYVVEHADIQGAARSTTCCAEY